MKRFLLFISLLLLALPIFSQSTIDPLDWYKGVSKDSIKRYKVFDYYGDSTYVDTTLTIKKYFNLNLLRKDDLLLQKFANQGENYNWLSYQEGHALIPEMGFRTKHFNYLTKQDIKYYDVATPTTQLSYKIGYYRGQFLDAIFTTNITPNLNFSAGYKGLRSVGQYINSLTSQGNLKISLNYISKNKNYSLKTFFTFQDLYNQESGGIEYDSLFTSGNPDFSTRTAFKMNLTNAESFIKGKNLYINHYYKLPFEVSKLGGKLFVQHIVDASTKYYTFRDKVGDNRFYFGSDALNTTETSDSTNYINIQNDLFLGVRGKHGRSFIKAGMGYNNQNYGYSSLKVIDDNHIIPAYIKGNTVSVKAAARVFPFENISIEGNGSYNISGKYAEAFELFGKANYNIKNTHNIGASLGIYSFNPELQFWLYQSNYKEYNYFNRLKRQNKLDFKFYFESSKWFDTYVRYVNQSNYTYFDNTNRVVDLPPGKEIPKNAVTPVKTVQYDNDLNIVEVGLHKEFKFGLFGFDTRTVFQKVLSGEDVFRVPEIVTRNTVYYHDDWFKHALEVQTGVGLKYFTEFSSFQYNPINGMYFRPEEDLMIGNFPIFNFFFNARIRTIRIYVEIENFTAPFGGNNYFSAPHYPSSDLNFRFGFVWNFFS